MEEKCWRKMWSKMIYRTYFLGLSAKENIFEQLTRRTAISLAPKSHHCPQQGCPNRHNLMVPILSSRPSIPATTKTTAANIINIITVIIVINIDVLSVTNIIVNICTNFLVLIIQKLTSQLEEIVGL